MLISTLWTAPWTAVTRQRADTWNQTQNMLHESRVLVRVSTYKYINRRYLQKKWDNLDCIQVPYHDCKSAGLILTKVSEVENPWN